MYPSWYNIYKSPKYQLKLRSIRMITIIEYEEDAIIFYSRSVVTLRAKLVPNQQNNE